MLSEAAILGGNCHDVYFKFQLNRYGLKDSRHLNMFPYIICFKLYRKENTLKCYCSYFCSVYFICKVLVRLALL